MPMIGVKVIVSRNNYGFLHSVLVGYNSSKSGIVHSKELTVPECLKKLVAFNKVK